MTRISKTYSDGFTSDEFVKFFELFGVDTSYLRVYIYLFEHSNKRIKTVTATYNEIANGAKVSQSTVTRAINRFEKEGFIEKFGPSCWKIDIGKLDDGSYDDDVLDGLAVYFRDYCVSED